MIHSIKVIRKKPILLLVPDRTMCVQKKLLLITKKIYKDLCCDEIKGNILYMAFVNRQILLYNNRDYEEEMLWIVERL